MKNTVLSPTTNLEWKHKGGQQHVCKGTSQQSFQVATECRGERYYMRMKAKLFEGKSEAGANHLRTEGKMLRCCIGRLVFCCLQSA